VEYKFKKGLKGNTDTNKRFVGYIAQQIESVVPQAVSLIDGILHVDYESLIPYLSESIKQNFKDINDLNSKTDHIHQVVDMMYNEFIGKERQHSTSSSGTSPSLKSSKKWRWITTVSVSIILVLSVALGLFLALRPSDMKSLTPLTPSTPASTVPSPGSEPTPPMGQMIDMMVLHQFYATANGIHWGDTKWMTDAPFCEWEGVVCNEEGRVVQLRLALDRMQGTLIDAIGHLDQLQDLVISYTALGGTIPKTLADLTHLEHLNLDYNKFEGVVPTELFTLPNLKSMSISGNNNFLPWNIPSTIQNATSLEDLVLDGCRVIGTFPAEIATLPNLLYLSLENNALTGTVPSLKTSSLLLLHLWGNQLSGIIPPLPGSMNILDLSNNNFTGGLTNINELINLTQLSLYSNNLSGEFWLNDQLMGTIQKLNIQNNEFSSVAPSLANATAPQFKCDVSDNNFKCPIPSWMITECDGDCV
jgi:Leucine-rich repeat (LRR) protein